MSQTHVLHDNMLHHGSWIDRTDPLRRAACRPPASHDPAPTALPPRPSPPRACLAPPRPRPPEDSLPVRNAHLGITVRTQLLRDLAGTSLRKHPPLTPTPTLALTPTLTLTLTTDPDQVRSPSSLSHPRRPPSTTPASPGR